MGPEMAHVGERPTDPLTVRVAPFSLEGETTFRTNVDGRDIELVYRAAGGRHELRVAGAPGAVEVDALDGASIVLVADQPR
jgi:hypothetical protein